MAEKEGEGPHKLGEEEMGVVSNQMKD